MDRRNLGSELKSTTLSGREFQVFMMRSLKNAALKREALCFLNNLCWWPLVCEHFLNTKNSSAADISTIPNSTPWVNFVRYPLHSLPHFIYTLFTLYVHYSVLFQFCHNLIKLIYSYSYKKHLSYTPPSTPKVN